MSPTDAVLDFMRTARGWMQPADIVRALEALGKFSDGAWPQCSTEAWESAIESLLASRQLLTSPDGIRSRESVIADATPPKRAKSKPKQVKPTDQGMLF